MKIFCGFFLVCCLLLCQRSNAQKSKDTISVFFPFNISLLPEREKSKLDSLMYAEILDIGKDLLIVGYADFVGTNEYNDTLSRKRAFQVQNYLLSLGYKNEQIKLCIGKGEVAWNNTEDSIGRGHAPDRRVDIVMQKHLLRHPKVVAAAPKPNPLPPKPKTTLPPKRIEYVNAIQPAPEVKKHLDDIMDVGVNETILLNHILFPANSHYITPESRAELDHLVDVMKKHAKLVIRIEGHICCVTLFPDAFDEDEHDYTLSVNRARFIYEYLIDHKIAPERMSFIGFGRSRPIVVREQNEADMQKNRRVEIRVLAK